MAAGCSNTGGSTRVQVGAWASGASYDSANSQIDSDLSYLAKAQRSAAFKAFQVNCEGFSGDVETLYETLPTPDTALTNELNAAFTSWFNAAATCAKASSVRSDAYRDAVSEIASGERSYRLATQRLAHFGVK